jgi:RNA polymerase sigma-70 factor (ECF subfamily)
MGHDPHADLSDPLAGLIARVAERDPVAFRALYEASASRLLAIAQRVLNDAGAAEDVLQEVYLALWNGHSRVPETCRAPLAWLTTLTRNRAIDVARKRRPEVPLQWQGEDGEEHSFDIADDSATPPEQLQGAQEDARLTYCLACIAEEPRQALVLAYYEGLTHVEVAERLTRPLGTVKAWVRRSLLSLQECLQGGSGHGAGVAA